MNGHSKSPNIFKLACCSWLLISSLFIFNLFCYPILLPAARANDVVANTPERSLGVASLQAPGSSREAATKSDVRTFKFPPLRSLGALALVPREAKHVTGSHQVAMCKGSVTITVPPDRLVVLATNQYAVLHPEQLMEVSPAGIDGVKISFMSMDENEDGLCDKALRYASHFTDAFRLDVSESDASDAGIASIANMPKLRSLWLGASSVRGSCLRNIERFPALEEIDFSRCTPFHQPDLKNLSKLHNLVSLEFDDTGITSEGLKNISSCKNLEFLNLNRNKRIDDDCMSLLMSLKKLRALSLQETPVSVNGLRSLAGMNLKTLSLTRSHFTRDELAAIRKILPKTIIHTEKVREAKSVSKIIFSPILGHF